MLNLRKTGTESIINILEKLKTCMLASHMCRIIMVNRSFLPKNVIRKYCVETGELCRKHGCVEAGDNCIMASDALEESEEKYLELCRVSYGMHRQKVASMAVHRMMDVPVEDAVLTDDLRFIYDR